MRKRDFGKWRDRAPRGEIVRTLTYVLRFAQSDLKRSGEHERLAQRPIANTVLPRMDSNHE